MNSDSINKIKNYYRIDDKIASAGQPAADEFNLIRQAGFDLIINLALPDSPHAIENEAEIVNQENMDYLHIPVDFKAPSLTDLHRFFNVMEQHEQKNIFVHCALNWRVSAFLFLYRTIKCDYPVSDALSDLHNVWTPDDTWQAFIDSALAQYGINQ